MNIVIKQGTIYDVEQLAQLYDDLNDFLESNVNYPGWIKGVYPTREDAQKGIASNTLYIAKIAGEIVGSVILNHVPEAAYNGADWLVDAEYSNVFVVHTFVVHPAYLKCGVGKAIMDFAINHCIDQKAKAIRLDVYEKNVPAISLYKKYGFQYIDTVDLGLGKYGLHHFHLYEKVL